jgi:multidrug efflux system membrane fusion protein
VAQAQVDNAGHDKERAIAAQSAAKADLRSARRAAKDAVIRAPIDGIVTRRQVDVGDTLVPGAPLMDVVDLSRVRVTVGLNGRNLGRIEPSLPVALTVVDLGGVALSNVRFASAATSSNPVTGLFDVEFHADNPGARGRAGMVATLTMTPRAKEGARLVAREALTRRGGVLGVFVIDGGTARFEPVKTGGRDGQFVELLEGPAPGTVLATSALHALADGVGVEVEATAAP